MEHRVRAAQRGDPEAMEALVRDLMPYVGRVCGAIALDRGDDAVQETFIAVLRSLGSLPEPAALKGWVRRIAVRSRSGSAGGRTVAMDPDTMPLPEVALADIATSLDIRATLASLPPEQRAILVPVDVDGLSEPKWPAPVESRLGTVKSRVHRARGRIPGEVATTERSHLRATGKGWPVASLDPIGRAKVLTATIPSAAYHHGVIDAPYEAVWSHAIDFRALHFPDFRLAGRSSGHPPSGGTAADVTHLRMTATGHGVSLPFHFRIEARLSA